MDPDALRALLEEAEAEAGSRAARETVCGKVAAAFIGAGNQLWIYGHALGDDRATGASPFSFGSDGLVGLATVAQIAGELIRGANLLLDRDNAYAAAALIRQLVEVEYLTWAFAEDHAEAATWLRSTRSDRLKMWQPRHVREGSAGRFRGSDYQQHCEHGGHPTPGARPLLPNHAPSPRIERYEVATHGTTAWEYLLTAAEQFGYGSEIAAISATLSLPEAIASWRRDDHLRQLLAELPTAGAEDRDGT